MKSRPIVFSSLALYLVTSSVALAQGPGRSVQFGVLAGGVFAKVAGDAVSGEEVKTRVGIAAGGFVTLGLNRNLAIEPQVLFVQKGAKSTESSTTSQLKLSYIEVPVLLKLRFPGKSGGTVVPHLYAGPYLAFKAGCRLSSTSGSVTVSGACEDSPFDFKVKSTDFGATVGGGVEVGRAIIDVRYDLGLSKIPDATFDDELKNRAFYLMVGWTFRSPR